MHATIVYVHVNIEFVEEFIAASRENHLASIHESGNLRFDVLQDHNDPTRFILYEAYASAEHAAAHKLTAHYAKWRDKVAPWMAEARHGVTYQMLCPE